jgi:DNA-binding HxlR family transcriptional regulator
MPEQKLRCYVSHAAEFLSEPWTMLILREFMIFGGTRRFEQLNNALGISRNVLTKRLRRLMELGLIKKSPIFDNGRRMEYKLRRKAWELSPVMLALHVWAERWAGDGYESEIDFVDVFIHKPLAKGAMRSQDGRTLEPGEIRVVTKTENAKRYMEMYKTRSINKREKKNEAA